MLSEIFFILLGLIAGSFLNVVICRLPRKGSIVRPPSRCPQCGTRLAWFDLVPLISYLALRGKCRHCGERISFRYPAVELLTAALFLVVFITVTERAKLGYLPGLHLPWVLAKDLFFAAGLIAATFIDLEHRLIPDRLNLALLAGAVALVPQAGDVTLKSAVLGGAAAGGALLLLGLLFKGGMGGGDIKLAAVSGLYLGWPGAVIGLFIGAVLGGIVGISLMVARIKGRKDFIPFGPFMSAGFLAALLWGGEIIQSYRSYFGVG